jgi:serine-type D-Ala-D-Ala carboxypeptidase/endopeptidase (penicillin-binding protein 4)
LESLRNAGVRCDSVEIGSGPQAPQLASHESPALASLLPEMGKWSDNFYAETIFKVLGAERHRPGRAEDSVAAVRAFLETAHLPVDRISIVNGSGLFTGNRIAAQNIADLLVYMYRDPALRSEYVAHLAIGGVDGTLRSRLRNLPRPRIVRAKTGTLRDTIALSGYVLGPTPEQVYAFSVLTNGVGGHQNEARDLADSVARTLATDLYPN